MTYTPSVIEKGIREIATASGRTFHPAGGTAKFFWSVGTAWCKFQAAPRSHSQTVDEYVIPVSTIIHVLYRPS